MDKTYLTSSVARLDPVKLKPESFHSAEMPDVLYPMTASLGDAP